MRRMGLGCAVVAGALAFASCSSSEGSSPTTVDAPPCPTDAVEVVVTVNQWADVVRHLGGACTEVTTIIDGVDVDPHEFEPSPADSARFTSADLVVMNGLGYDAWAERAVDTVSPRPPVVDAGRVVGREDGDNPHLWYSPDAVEQVADAVTTELQQLLPDATSYLADQAAAWEEEMAPYRDEIASLRTTATGKTYAATESVFDDMAAAVGLTDRTPSGYRSAALNESDPSPADVNAFEQLLRDRGVDVLVVNTQTEGSIPEQIRGVAEAAGVAVVEVTEGVPAGSSSFVDWQVTQLRALHQALGG